MFICSYKIYVPEADLYPPLCPGNVYAQVNICSGKIL